jgi:hypothetical protein
MPLTILNTHGAPKSISPRPHRPHAANDSAPHTGPISHHAYHGRKFLCKISCLHLSRLCHHQNHHFSNLTSISESQYDSCMSTLRWFENLLFLVQNSCFTALFFDSCKVFFSRHSRN